ncbi:tail assembly chaperone [Gordonia phage EMoore]|uniref:Tail assembly chaperone n=1 Tax=Gordonia phage EMoore TaxID=2656534 RepID=A0A649VW57_9CAUD|nr:tail assembly chaperone [Gordonia phage EMoore]QGJ95813.1 tail assembly chaperone [Gordonia phage EMoore]
MAAAPKATASVATWRKFMGEQYPEIDTTGMTRADMRDVHKLRQEDSHSPAAELASADDVDISSIPDELQFSTDTGEDRELERVAITLDGNKFWLERPSDAAMTLYMNQLLSDDPRTRTNAMVNLVQQSLDTGGLMYVQQRVLDKANNFDDQLYGSIVGAVLNRWGDDFAATKFAQIQKAEQQNRAARRAAARRK